MNPITNRKKLLSLLISQALVVPTQAAVFNINCGDVAELINTINIANNDSDADEINLNVDNQANCVYPLTAVDNMTDGNNSLPSITSPITINGSQSAIRRQDGSAFFRIIHISLMSNLNLKQLTIENGSVTGGFLEGGGGIFNRGELTLEYSTVSENTSNYGGGILNSSGTTATLINSIVSGNTVNESGGGGIFNDVYATAILTNSTISRNIAY